MWSALRMRLSALMVALALSVGVAQAQQKDPRLNPPLQPITNESTSKSGENPPAQEVQSAKQPPLGGAENYGLGGIGGRSFFVGSLRFSQGFDTNSTSTPGARQYNSQTTLHGNIQMDRIWNRYQFSANYSTGGVLYNNASGQNSPVHNLTLSNRFTGRRAAFTLSDSFSLLPESSFGFGGFGGIGNLGGLAGLNPLNYSGSGFGQGSNLDPFFTPDQSIFTARSKRISNTVMGQLSYPFSARNSLVASASYGIMRFLEGAFIESDSISARLTYSRMLNATDSLGVSYNFGQVDFTGIDRNMENHAAHLVYGRRLTGRMAMQLSAGPQLNRFYNPVAGNGRRTSWSARGTLTYQLATADLSFGYSRQSTGGSGVLLGSDSNVFDGSISKQLSRMWDLGVNFGYAHNRALRELAIGPTDTVFNSWRTGATLSRPLGRSMRLFFNYNTQWQSVNFCSAPGVCVPNLTRHHFAAGLSWQSRPISLE